MLGTLLTYINKRDLVHICVVLGTDHYFWDGGGGGVGNFHRQANNFCVSVFPQTLSFACRLFTSVFTASENNLFQNFSTPSSRQQKINSPSLTESRHEKLGFGIDNFFYTIKQQQTNVLVAGLYYAIPC